jgi:cob(I)alamin adenosyltransferase
MQKLDRSLNRKRGFIQVYTGNGKGKTTAALGLALRAAGAGLKVFICQFLKGRPSSELKSLKKLSADITIRRCGGKSFVIHPRKDDKLCARQAFRKVSKILSEGIYDVVVLDEINCAVAINLIDINSLIKLLKEKPRHVEVVLTGRDAPKKLLAIADLVTEMKEIKHYFREGVKARTGIEK